MIEQATTVFVNVVVTCSNGSLSELLPKIIRIIQKSEVYSTNSAEN